MRITPIVLIAAGFMALQFWGTSTYAVINITNNLKVPDKSGKCVGTELQALPRYVIKDARDNRTEKHQLFHCQGSSNRKYGYGDSHPYYPCSSTVANTHNSQGYAIIRYWDKVSGGFKYCTGTASDITIRTGDCGDPQQIC